MNLIKLKIALAWLSSLAVTVLITKTYLENGSSGIERSLGHIQQQSSLTLVNSVSNETYGIQSRSENNGEGNARSRNIFYNRVGKCGSRSLLYLTQRLANINKFNFVGSRDYKHIHPEPKEVRKEAWKISKLKPPTFYNRHIHFIDFQQVGYEKPIYINMIRNPVDRFVSQYNYLKYGDNSRSMRNLKPDRMDINECVDKEVDLCNDTMFTFYIGMHFCGMDSTCLVRSMERVSLAKKHLDEEFTLVGMLEEFETTLLLLEKLLPDYYSGALQAWKKNHRTKKSTATKKIDTLTEESIHKLQTKILAEEFEVYNFAKQKFDRLKKKFGLNEEQT